MLTSLQRRVLLHFGDENRTATEIAAALRIDTVEIDGKERNLYRANTARRLRSAQAKV